jgi:hypothetical protein
MQNVAKKQNATFTMAFLFATMVITPLSLKALGISPSFSAGVEAWRHIAGIFADSHQPLNAAELLALNLAPVITPGQEGTRLTGGLLASTQPLDMQLTAEPALSIGDRLAASSDSVAAPVANCAKSTMRAPRRSPSAPLANKAIVAIDGMRGKGFTGMETAQVVVPIRREAMRSYERAMASYRVDLGDAMKFVPKDFRLMIKVKPSVLPALPAITNCAFRKALTPEKVKPLRVAARALAFEDAIESAEKGEL